MAEQCGRGLTLLKSKQADDIEHRRDALAQRLDDGYDRIKQAVTDGTDVTAWEDFWIDLLREYEAVCDELAAAA